MSHSNFLLTASLFVFGAVAPAAWSQQQTGTVAGAVYDSQTGRPISGARVAVDGHSDARHVTDSAGQFQIPLPPGTYKLRYSADNYAEIELGELLVSSGKVTEASSVMTNKALVTTVDVVEKVSAVGATAEAMLSERKLSAVVSDGLSRDELRSGSNSDAAGALEKVTGVSVVGEGYVYVRGLGERYSATMLNSALIPTTEPERRVVPLDLFPTELIDSINIVKTYTPDLPGEFSGGLVQMKTVEFPTQPMLRVSTKAGYNTRTTGDSFLSYPGGGRDFFGFDDGSRSLPAAIPGDKRLFQGSFPADQRIQFGRAFSNNWEPSRVSSARPAQSYSVVGGNTFGRLGLVGAVTFSNKPQFQSEEQRYLRQSGTAPVVFTEYKDFRSYTESARLGAVLNAAVRLAPAHKLLFRNTLTHDAEKEAREFSGYDGTFDSEISSQRLRWIDRNLTATSVEGDHAFAGLGNSVVKWQLTYSRSSRNEPDMREVLRGKLSDGRSFFLANGSSGIRFYNDLTDEIYEPQVEYGVPFFKGSLSGMFKTGFRAVLRNRDFQARRFRYIPQDVASLDLTLPSNQLFAPANLRPDGFEIVEYTRGTDRYNAEMNIYAGYAMVDLGLGPRWRVIGGLRVEDADIRVSTVDPLVPNAQLQAAKLWNRDPIPGVNLIYALRPRQNLRFSYSRTVSRPDFRELSPFDFNNVLGGFVAQGNPDLKRASIQNFDARWEYFPGGNQLLAASFFVKRFADPIEQTILPANDLRQTFVNAKSARNYGLELEARHGLGILHRRLSEFAGAANFTFVDSKIGIRDEDALLLTSKNRPLLGQSRYIANAIVEWNRPKWRSNARFYTNYVSRRITDVGTFRLPDIYQEPGTTLDFVYQLSLAEGGKWQMRFDADNLADTRSRWTQGDFVHRSYQMGRTFSIGVGYSIF